MRNSRIQQQKPLNLLALFLACSVFGSTYVHLAEAQLTGFKSPLESTPHLDGRGTTKLLIPGPGETPVGDSRKGAEAFLRNRQAEFKLPPNLSNLEFLNARQSLLGTHYRYRQILNGVPVEGADVVVSIRRDNGEVYQAYNDSYPVEIAPVQPKAVLSEDDALDVAWNHLRVHGKLLQGTRANLVYLPEKGGFRLAYKTLVAVEAPFGYWEHKVDAVTGEVISVRDTAVRLKRQREPLPKFGQYSGEVWSRTETTQEWQAAAALSKTSAPANKTVVDGTAKVFDGDPRTYLAMASLTNTSPAASFTPAYVTRTLRQISENAGVYSLDGPWVVITDFEAPTAAPSTTTTGNWTATRGINAFNDVMTYYHIDQNQRYLQSLGYVGATGIQYGPIQADSNGVQGDDNSYFLPSSNQLSFGHGGVDDNEDADVILHEYGHAITHDIVPSWGGGDTGALGEGFGDYWGASYSSTTVNGKTFHPEWAFSWDGHSTDTWPGRFLNMTNLTYDPTHNYIAHEPINGIDNYSDQLWSAHLWAAFSALTGAGYARTNIDKIVIESFFGIGGAPSMRVMAYATINAANQLFPSEPYGAVFSEKFANQNIIPPPLLSDPILLAPLGGETFRTGSVVQVSWDRNGAPASAKTQIEYSAGSVTNFSDRMEAGVNGWVVTRGAGTVNWSQTTTASHSATHSWFVPDAAALSDSYLRSPLFTVSSQAVLSFWHQYDFEAGYDGGVVEVSLNGTTWADLGGLSSQNGYNSTIDTGFSSPIGGRSAFSGSTTGFIQTVIPLNTYAGKSIYIRFRSACDSDTGSSGWWVDDVTVTREWVSIAVAPAGAATYAWNTPNVAGTNYALRLKQTASGYSDSGWVQSSLFTLGNSVTAPNIQSVVVNNGTATVTWSSVSGTAYRVQFKNSPDDANWTSLSPDVVANGATATKVDQPLTTKRFYRVIVP